MDINFGGAIIMIKYMKQIALLVASILLIGFTFNFKTTSAAVPFTDLKADAWYYSDIDELYNKGIAFGANGSSTLFKPGQNATRGETAQFIANALGLDLMNVKDPGFTDVPKSHPHYAAIAALTDEGYISGVGNNKFNPNGTILRVHFATIMTKSFDLKLSNVTKSKFADVNQYATAAKNPNFIKYVETLVAYGITQGKTTTTFAPKDNVTRAELTKFVKKAMDATNTDEDFEVIGVE